MNICPICKKQFSNSDRGKNELKKHMSAKKDPYHQFLAKKKRTYKLATYQILYVDYIEELRKLKETYGSPKHYTEENIIDIEDEGLM